MMVGPSQWDERERSLDQATPLDFDTQATRKYIYVGSRNTDCFKLIFLSFYFTIFEFRSGGDDLNGIV